MEITFKDRVAIITGSARGLGLSYARAFAARGARVAIADLGAEADMAALALRGEGGAARAFHVDVTDFAQVERMVAEIRAEWGRADVAVCNAGILRDRSFGKMELEDFRSVMDVHVMGSVHLCRAVWPLMREQNYGRVILTTSSSGLYGTFGQANYGAAKAAMLGLMNVLHLEGERRGIRVNCIMPSAATRMTAGLFKPDVERLLTPDSVAPGVLFLASEQAPSRVVLSAGAGTFARVYVTETEGVSFAGASLTPEAIAAQFEGISDPATAREVPSSFAQADKLAASAQRILDAHADQAR
jgi:NAD(P)-dependent dehydrogenase (short-subunit alcohol dehydrogenase family)